MGSSHYQTPIKRSNKPPKGIQDSSSAQTRTEERNHMLRTKSSLSEQRRPVTFFGNRVYNVLLLLAILNFTLECMKAIINESKCM